MEFDELRKIWDTQNNTPMYAINEDTLHKRIVSKKDRTARLVNLAEIGLIIINLVVGIFLFWDSIIDNEGIYSYLIAVFMLFSAGYLIISRVRRRREENRFDRSMLGDLDHAIANADRLIVLSQKVIWWYNLPILSLLILKLLETQSSWLTWLLIAVAFILAYFLGRWELNRCHLPRKEALKNLRNTLTQDNSEIVT